MTVSVQAFDVEICDNWGTSKAAPGGASTPESRGLADRNLRSDRLMAIMSCALMVRIDVLGIPIRTVLLNGGSACG